MIKTIGKCVLLVVKCVLLVFTIVLGIATIDIIKEIQLNKEV